MQPERRVPVEFPRAAPLSAEPARRLPHLAGYSAPAGPFPHCRLSFGRCPLPPRFLLLELLTAVAPPAAPRFTASARLPPVPHPAFLLFLR
ncbi:unnamed protein product [Arctogadus glacialis]